MAISAMGKKCVVLALLGLAMCLLLSSFQEVSCQVDGGRDLRKFDISPGHREYQANVQEKEEEESGHSMKRESERKIWENNTVIDRKKISMSLSDESEENLEDSFGVDNFIQSEAASGHDEVGRRSSSMMDEIDREIEAHLGSLNKQAGSVGVKKLGESKDAAVENDAERRKQVEEIERKMEAAAATRFGVEEGIAKRKSRLETHKFKFEGDESVDGESRKYQLHYGTTGDEESAKGAQVTNKAEKIESEEYEAASTESSQVASAYNVLKKGNGGSRMLESLAIAQSGVWRCVNQDKNGVEGAEEASIVIPQYSINDIIKEESISQGTASKTSSLVASLTEIVEKHKKDKWSADVTTQQSSETLENIKMTLKKYRAISARELVTRSDFEEILTMAARYEELSSASVSYISRLSMYRSVIKEGIKASQRAQLAQARAKLLKDMALEKQKNVDTEFASVKALAQRGDMLYVKIFAIKKLVMKLEAEKEEVDMKFQNIVGNLSRVLEDASQAYEEYHEVVRKWKEEQAAEEFSREAIESAEIVWVKFLSTL